MTLFFGYVHHPHQDYHHRHHHVSCNFHVIHVELGIYTTCQRTDFATLYKIHIILLFTPGLILKSLKLSGPFLFWTFTPLLKKNHPYLPWFSILDLLKYQQYHHCLFSNFDFTAPIVKNRHSEIPKNDSTFSHTYLQIMIISSKWLTLLTVHRLKAFSEVALQRASGQRAAVSWGWAVSSVYTTGEQWAGVSEREPRPSCSKPGGPVWSGPPLKSQPPPRGWRVTRVGWKDGRKSQFREWPWPWPWLGLKLAVTLMTGPGPVTSDVNVDFLLVYRSGWCSDGFIHESTKGEPPPELDGTMVSDFQFPRLSQSLSS